VNYEFWKGSKVTLPKGLRDLHDLLIEQFTLDGHEAAYCLGALMGKTDARIAQWLGLSLKLIDNYRLRTYDFLKVSNDEELKERIFSNGTFRQAYEQRKTDSRASRLWKVEQTDCRAF
jgi:hypothetical protein